MADDDEEESEVGLYENGYWIWDDEEKRLEFKSTLPPVREETKPTLVVVTGEMEFRDGIDVIEQMRFRKHYRRKVATGDPDVVTVQDIKDIAIYTAPTSFITPMLINFLHLPATDRFLRALIFYCQYYLQVTDTMIERLRELQRKIRTPHGTQLEGRLRENLNDFRLLVAKEYCLMVYGTDGYRWFHHMGPHKISRSMSFRDCRLYETFTRMCVQIAWIGLNRKCFNRLELEINRLFKSDTFNSVQHKFPSSVLGSTMTKEERNVLFGECVQKVRKLHTRSPLVNEVFCERRIDYRLVALGNVKQKNLPPRLAHLCNMIVCPEEYLEQKGVTCGILGKQRDKFDIMLRLIEMPIGVSSTDVSSIRSSKSMNSSRHSKRSQQSVMSGGGRGLTRRKVEAFDNIAVPCYKNEAERAVTAEFPEVPLKTRHPPYLTTQRLRWLERIKRMHLKDKRPESEKS